MQDGHLKISLSADETANDIFRVKIASYVISPMAVTKTIIGRVKGSPIKKRAFNSSSDFLGSQCAHLILFMSIQIQSAHAVQYLILEIKV